MDVVGEEKDVGCDMLEKIPKLSRPPPSYKGKKAS